MLVPTAASSSPSALPDFSSSIFYPSYRLNISQLYSLKVCLPANFMLFRNINQIFGALKFWNIRPGYSFFVPDFFYLPWTLTLSLMKRLWEPLEPKLDNENDVRFFVPLDFGLIKPISHQSDEPFHNFRASASGFKNIVRRILRHQNCEWVRREWLDLIKNAKEKKKIVPKYVAFTTLIHSDSS